MRRNLVPFLFLVALAFCLPAIARAEDPTKLVAKLNPASDSKVMGTVTFTAAGDETQVMIDITGLTPGQHGFHIHEKGDCSDPKAASAGAHFNPGQSHHGGPLTAIRHAGDFGNVEADATGKVHLELKQKGMKMSGPESVVGKSIIVHAKEDDLKTDPTGNSGDRVACGVIEAAK